MLRASTATEVLRGMEILKGIVTGIAMDYKLSDEEIAGLTRWLSEHGHLLEHEPFMSIGTKVANALEDNDIDPDEREDILDWCLTYTESEAAKCYVTRAVRQLLGVMHGMTIDGKVTDAEIRDLNDWLHEYENCWGVWPFNMVRAQVDDVLADGHVTEDERRGMQEFLTQFSYNALEDLALHDAPGFEDSGPASVGPIYETFTALCDRDVIIAFRQRGFCFTGQARTGPRKDLSKLVVERGGITKSGISRKVNYLIIGAQSNPNWVYESYGRKIEDAEGLRRDGHDIFILHEDDFVRQL